MVSTTEYGPTTTYTDLKFEKRTIQPGNHQDVVLIGKDEDGTFQIVGDTDNAAIIHRLNNWDLLIAERDHARKDSMEWRAKTVKLAQIFLSAWDAISKSPLRFTKFGKDTNAKVMEIREMLK